MVPPHTFSADDPDDGNVFHCLCRNGTIESLQSFKMLISDVNSYLLQEFDPSGQQCLHIAASQSTAESRAISELLIRSGADINVPDKIHGDTPLHIAARTRNFSLVNWICQQSAAKIDARNFEMKTPWHIAFDQTDWTIMWLLQFHDTN